jgi:hypothetical protein
MLYDAIPIQLRQTVRFSEDAISNLLEADICATRYLDPKRKASKRRNAERFLDALFSLHVAIQGLESELRQTSDTFVLTASGPERLGPWVAMSAHDLIETVASDAVGLTIDAMLRKALPKSYPPQGEYFMPDQMPCRSDCLSHIDAAIRGFVRATKGAGTDGLSSLSVRMNQELLKVLASLHGSATDDNTLDNRATDKWRFAPGEAVFGGIAVPLRGSQWNLLKALVESRSALAEQDLIEAAWGQGANKEPKTLQNQLSSLRRILRKHLSLTYDPLPVVDSGANRAWKIAEDLR